jgi:hypothetical protein
MSNFNVRAWYKGAVAASVGLMGVSALASKPELLAFGLGLLMLGLGEWINHPFQTRIIPPTYGMPTGGIASGEVRSPRLVGVAFGAVGLCLLAIGLFKLVWPLIG